MTGVLLVLLVAHCDVFFIKNGDSSVLFCFFVICLCTHVLIESTKQVVLKLIKLLRIQKNVGWTKIKSQPVFLFFFKLKYLSTRIKIKKLFEVCLTHKTINVDFCADRACGEYY